MKFLYVNSVFLVKSLDYRGFVKLLTIAQFFYDTGFFKFAFELLQRFLDVLAFFYRYYNHFFSFKKLKWLIKTRTVHTIRAAKLHIVYLFTKHSAQKVLSPTQFSLILSALFSLHSAEGRPNQYRMGYE